MNPLWGHFAGVITVILMLTFIGIWIWVWSARHKRKYDALARLPMEDEPRQDEENPS
jgi:cytochrome c oxidase cbb3-type subunit 4